ncbi:MAG TPA: (E)-4-hydroxy-3-methylbut-2-enyl-diphosphate synthase [Treponemataceae bacterium]|nr:(E)-4-hydroxy-3-methylbut-2-enyl-diphosphate synthase [Treponemataceae bacterium]
MSFSKKKLLTIGGQSIKDGQTVERISFGSDSLVSIQTMWKESILSVLDSKEALLDMLRQINQLKALGCDILRFAVPDKDSAKALCIIAEHTTMPVVADIHFDYKLALACLDGPVAKIRINPGNIGSRENIEKVVNKCRQKGAAIRIGVNSGSLPKDLYAHIKKGKITRVQAIVQTALKEVAMFEELGFDQIVVSMKSSSVQETIEANETFAKLSDIPLHIGVTEAGPLIGGIVKSTLALSHLLKQNIGSTIRISLSSDPINEIIAAKALLGECGLRAGGVKIISCPRCGRNGFDVHGFVNRWQNELLSLNKDITIAVMGCIVNGPGEGKHADLGICGAANSVLLFKKGEIVHRIRNDDLKILSKTADELFREELESL